jgi:DNA-binding GntR family transcriptional regulator
MYDKLKIINLGEYKPLRDIVFETLKEAILKGKLEPKERLMEIQLADQLGVSRTPVREAIRKLELEGLVIMEPRKGAYVSDISYADIIDTLEVREALETYAVRLAIDKGAAERIGELEELNIEFEKAYKEEDIQEMVKYDTEIHNMIVELSGNKKLIAFMDALNEIMQRFRLIYFNETYNPEVIIREHKEVFEAINSRDKERAVKGMTSHLSTLKDDIKEVFKKN